MQRLGKIDDAEMFRTFNMGLGMIIVCAPEHADEIKSHVELSGSECYRVGSTVRGSREVIIK
jgi:phosphoribosylformylglycinamidine cyclo-ligase